MNLVNKILTCRALWTANRASDGKLSNGVIA